MNEPRNMLLDPLEGERGRLLRGGISLPPDMLQGTPFADFTIPGLALSIVVGGSFLFAAAALIFWRKSDDLMALLASFCLVALGGSFPDIPTTLAAIHPASSLVPGHVPT